MVLWQRWEIKRFVTDVEIDWSNQAVTSLDINDVLSFWLSGDFNLQLFVGGSYVYDIVIFVQLCFIYKYI